MQKHGESCDASVSGKRVKCGKAYVNPDGLGGEGDVAQVGRR